MQFNGEWLLCDDEIVRPIIRGEVLSSDGFWRAAEFLIDTGADRTVFSVNVLSALGLKAIKSKERIGGVGGLVNSIIVETQIRFTREDTSKVVLRGKYAACLEQETLDMSVLGRDILEMFVVIIDRPGNAICLLGGAHKYKIEKQ